MHFLGRNRDIGDVKVIVSAYDYKPTKISSNRVLDLMSKAKLFIDLLMLTHSDL